MTRSWKKKRKKGCPPFRIQLEALGFKYFEDLESVEINKAERGSAETEEMGDEASIIFNTNSQPTSLWYECGNALPVCGPKIYPKLGNCRASYSLNEETMVKIR